MVVEKHPVQQNTMPSVLLAVLGIVLVGTWSNVLGYSALLLPPNLIENATALSNGFIGGRLAAALLFIILAEPMQRLAGSVGLTLGAFLSPLALIMCLAVRQSAADYATLSPDLVLAASSFVSSIGFLVLSVPLFVRLIRILRSRWAALFAMIGLVGECLLSSLLNSYGSFDVQLLFCLIAPLSAGFCLFFAERLSRQIDLIGEKAPTQQTVRIAEPSSMLGLRDSFGSMLMILQLSFAMILATALRSLSAMGSWGLLHEGYLGVQAPTPNTLVICAITVVATLAIFVVPRRIPTQARCALALLVVLAGFQLAVSGLGADGRTSSLVQTATMGCQLFCRVIIWITFMECVRQLRMPALRINGVTCLFNVVGSLLFSIAGTDGASRANVALFIIYALLSITVVAIVLPFIDRPSLRKRKEPADDVAAAHEEASQEAIGSFAALHAISPREQQVFALLLDGCARGQIERLLGLSEGTVRTHVNAVYRKLDVHSKAEMRDAFVQWKEKDR